MNSDNDDPMCPDGEFESKHEGYDCRREIIAGGGRKRRGKKSRKSRKGKKPRKGKKSRKNKRTKRR